MRNNAAITFSPFFVPQEGIEGIEFIFGTDQARDTILIRITSVSQETIQFFIFKKDIARLNDLITKHVTYEK